MLLIISFHYVFHSGYVFKELNYNSFVVKTFYFFGELGVNLFILISGYFSVNGKFSAKKLIKLILEINFYYFLTTFIKSIIDNQSFSPSLFPTITCQYWFCTAYVLLYILSPFLNNFIHNIKQEDYKKLLLWVIVIWSVIPTLFGIVYNNVESYFYFSRFIWFVVIYLIGSYIRLYSIKIFNKRKTSIIIALASFAIMVLGIVVIYKYKFIFTKIDVAYFWPPNTLPMLLLSVSVFMIFLDIKINYSKIINRVASTTLGIYMLHDGVLNKYIWNNIFRAKEHLNSKFSILYILISAITIYICGMIIDLIRQFIEKHTVNKFLDSKIYNKISSKCKEILELILKHI